MELVTYLHNLLKKTTCISILCGNDFVCMFLDMANDCISREQLKSGLRVGNI